MDGSSARGKIPIKGRSIGVADANRFSFACKLGAHHRYFAAIVAVTVSFATFASVGGASASTPSAEIGADGMAPTYGKAANGLVAEVWPTGSGVQFRTLSAGTWTGSAPLAVLPDGLTVTSTTAAVGVNFLGNLEVYVVASDGQAWHSYAVNGASDWSAFSPLGAPAVPIAGDVAVGTNYLGNQEMYVRTTDGEVFHRFSTPGEGSGWSGWDTMGRPAAGVRGGVSAGKNYLGNQELYIVGNDGRPYHNFSTPGVGSGWNGWDPLDGPVTPLADVSAAINYTGDQELYMVGADGMVWHNYATPGSGSGWAGWSPLGAPVGVTATGDVAVQPHDFSVLGQQWIRVIASSGLAWQQTQTPGVGSGWTDWALSSMPPLPPWQGVDSARFVGSDRLLVGGRLFPGEFLMSADIRTALYLQYDGNLVLFSGGVARWNSGTSGQAIGFLTLQSDGNLVLYRTDLSPAWAAGTQGPGRAQLVVQGDGDLVLFASAFSRVWNTNTGGTKAISALGCDHLPCYTRANPNVLLPGWYLTSADHQHALVLESDGNLVLYGPGYHVLWNSGTSGQLISFLNLQNDGNLVLYRSDGSAAWATYTQGQGQGGNRLVLQNDGNLVLATPGSAPLWNSGTAGQI